MRMALCWMLCMKYKTTYSASDIESDVQSGTVPMCPPQRRNKKAKVSLSAKTTVENYKR